MQRTDGPNVDSRRLFKNALHLRTIFTADIKVVATSLTSPVVCLIDQRTKLAKAICRKQHLVQTVVTHNDLGPMHHRCRNEMQRMAPQFERIALLDGDNTPLEVETLEEVGQHFYCLGTANQLQTRIRLQYPSNKGCMIGLHMVGY